MRIIKSCVLFRHRRPGCRDFRLYGIKVEARARLHWRELDRGHGQLFDSLLDKYEAPEFVLEPSEVILRPLFAPAIGPARALERIEAKVGDIGHIRLGFVTQPTCRLIGETASIRTAPSSLSPKYQISWRFDGPLP
jgi:hypothetical protein